MRAAKRRRRAAVLVVPLLAGLLLLAACGFMPERVSRDDPRLAPLWAAIDRVDRERLGFTPIPPDAELRLEGKQVGRHDYDAMLHVEGNPSRTVAFRKAGSGYEWIGEQEILQGPKRYTTVDGTFNEQIAITYETSHVSGAPLNRTYVTYTGEDPRLANRSDLTLAVVAPILEEWKSRRR
jgi:hypothetical protein